MKTKHFIPLLALFALASCGEANAGASSTKWEATSEQESMTGPSSSQEAVSSSEGITSSSEEVTASERVTASEEVTSSEGITSSEEVTASSEASSESSQPTQKLAFSDLNDYLFSISNANAIGIQQRKTKTGLSRKAKENIEQVAVKITSEYSKGDPEVNEDGTVDVVFTRIDTSVTTNKIEGEENKIASVAEPFVPEIQYDEEVKTISVTNDGTHQFRLLSPFGPMMEDWTGASDAGVTVFSFAKAFENLAATDYIIMRKDDQGGEEAPVPSEEISADESSLALISPISDYSYRILYPDGTAGEWLKYEGEGEVRFDVILGRGIGLEDYKVESRSLDASISLVGYKGFEYVLVLTDDAEATPLQTITADEDNETIVFGGLTEGVSYTIFYEGYGEEIVIEQSSVDGEIDKILVYDHFTFMSFVPKDASQRPADEEMTYSKSGIAQYDLCDYFTSNQRASYLVDNDTGFIYPITNFNISRFQNGLLRSANDQFVYDFKVNEEGNVEIFPLYSNSSIQASRCFKDKYGHIYVENSSINTYDPKKDVTYFVPKDTSAYGYDNSVFDQYFLNDEGEAVKVTYQQFSGDAGYFCYALASAGVIQQDGTVRNLTADDNFKLLERESWEGQNQARATPVAVKNGSVLSVGQNPYQRTTNRWVYSFGINVFTLGKANHNYSFSYSGSETIYFDYTYLVDHDFLFAWYGGKVYTIRNLTKMANTVGFGGDFTGAFLKEGYYEVLVSDCTIQEDKIVTIGLDGNEYHEIVVEKDDDSLKVSVYEYGAYEPPKETVVLQPINR